MTNIAEMVKSLSPKEKQKLLEKLGVPLFSIINFEVLTQDLMIVKQKGEFRQSRGTESGPSVRVKVQLPEHKPLLIESDYLRAILENYDQAAEMLRRAEGRMR